MHHVSVNQGLKKETYLISRYTCQIFDKNIESTLFKWNTSVSSRCCHHCDGVIYKADTVIDTVQTNDECKTTETLTCRILPSKFIKTIKIYIQYLTFQIKSLQLCKVNIITSTVALMIQEKFYFY